MTTTPNPKDVYETAVERLNAGPAETLDARTVLNLPTPTTPQQKDPQPDVTE